MDEELKHCPFCGHKNVELYVQITTEPMDIIGSVRGNTCGATGIEEYVEFNSLRDRTPEMIISRIESAF